MTESEQYIPFKFIGNGFNESRSQFMSSNQQYFQKQYHYRSISFHPILSRSILFIISPMVISLMPVANVTKQYRGKLPW